MSKLDLREAKRFLPTTREEMETTRTAPAEQVPPQAAASRTPILKISQSR